MKRGGHGYDFDNELLNDQRKNIAKMNAMKEFDELEEQLNKKGPQEETKSFSDLLREKRENTEKIIESKNQGAETVEERKKRLQAQRDILMKQKADKREKELAEFKQKTSTQDDLHKQLMEIDKKTKSKQ